MCSDVELGPLLAGGCAIGLGLYLIACLVFWARPEFRRLMEAILSGGGLVAGGHLVYCSFCPDQLAHVVHDPPAHQAYAVLPAVANPPQNVRVRLGDLHTIDVFAGGVAIIFVSGLGLISLFTRSAKGHHG